MGKKSGALLCGTWVLTAVLSVSAGFGDENNKPATNPLSAAQSVDSISSTAAAPTDTTTLIASPQSVANIKAAPATPAWYDKISLRWDGIFYGPGIVDVNTYQPDLYNKNSYNLPTQTPIFFRNGVGLSYALPHGWYVGTTLRADVMPAALGRDYFIDDSYIHFMKPRLVSRGNFNMSGDLRFYFPTSSASRLFGQSFSVVTQFIPSYTFRGTRWSIGAIIRQQSYTHYSWANGSAMNTDAYAAPNINYQISSTLSAGVLYEFEAVHYHGTGAFDFTTQDPANPGLMTPTDVEPNVSWDITPRLNINPFLNLYPGGKFNLDTTSVGFFFGAKLI